MKIYFDINELLQEARISGYYDLSEIEYAVMEANGKISFMPKSKYDVVIEEVDSNENAGHISHVVARKKCESKECNVYSRIALVDDVFNSENNKRKINHRINPHNIPIVCDEIAAH